jgi:molybdopterin-guanine dinucleotide biosynthesis protein A
MEALREMRCVACRCDAPTVTKAEIAELHPQFAELEIVQHEGIEHLRRVFPFHDGALHRKDFIMAAKADDLYQRMSV